MFVCYNCNTVRKVLPQEMSVTAEISITGGLGLRVSITHRQDDTKQWQGTTCVTHVTPSGHLGRRVVSQTLVSFVPLHVSVTGTEKWNSYC